MASIDAVKSDIAMMIDNETLALGPDAFVTQVGICVANVVTREYIVQPQAYWMTTEGQDARVIDTGTVRWWLNQDPKVIRSVLAPDEGHVRTTPQQLFNVCKNLADSAPGMTVWASPAMFDLSMLTHLWGGRKPWKYNSERDMMTLYKHLDPEGAMRPVDASADMAHNAAADAKWQMEYLFNLLAHLRELTAHPSGAEL